MQFSRPFKALSAAAVLAVALPITANAAQDTQAVDEVLDRIVAETEPATAPDGETLTRALDEITDTEGAAAQAGPCRVHVWAPGESGGIVGVQGGRYDCLNVVNWRVDLWRDDIVGGSTRVDEVWGHGNGTVRAYADCAWASQDYWGEIHSDAGGFMVSPRARLC